jgi:uncharacterized protein (TIGR02266 family)
MQAIEERTASAEKQMAYHESQKKALIYPERRSSPRVTAEVFVSMQTEHNFYTGLTQDMSEGGVFIATMENIPVGTQLDLRVSVPGQSVIQVQGEVRWVREYNEYNQDFHPGVGVGFNNLSEEDRQAIASFISKREPLFYDNYA